MGGAPYYGRGSLMGGARYYGMSSLMGGSPYYGKFPHLRRCLFKGSVPLMGGFPLREVFLYRGVSLWEVPFIMGGAPYYVRCSLVGVSPYGMSPLI